MRGLRGEAELVGGDTLEFGEGLGVAVGGDGGEGLAVGFAGAEEAEAFVGLCGIGIEAAW